MGNLSLYNLSKAVNIQEAAPIVQQRSRSEIDILNRSDPSQYSLES